jgi:phosphoribosylanthranilate isomerase
MRIKVCGITNTHQVGELNELGVEFCGFIFYPESPRYIFKHGVAEDIKKIKGKINKAGVFVNAKAEDVMKAVNNCGLHLVQLHGDETPHECEKIKSRITTIKAFRLTEDDDIMQKIKDYQNAVDMFLFDTEGVGYGGTGKKFSWKKLSGLNINKPFFLSGGIQPDDMQQLKEFAKDPVAKNLFAVDINSKFETAPGIKNMNMVSEFVHQIKQNL